MDGGAGAWSGGLRVGRLGGGLGSGAVGVQGVTEGGPGARAGG